MSADGQLHFLTIFMGILLTAIAIIGIVMKPKNTRIRMSWPGIAIILVYIAGAYMLYLLSGSA